ncbi:hypothetical protein FHR75_003319 [Kineococcus radiotolerans]|uniref:Uncharacterized protein n=1 Tax=Kineococcus radiotolerans TaxID=131568 RepID=A0A7W4TPW0_KINRA|nr:hypothetical protein [Kineococcus radiotolerans]MBB2902488.1 hypothetical protein [Kineococcus radiotolerans]
MTGTGRTREAHDALSAVAAARAATRPEPLPRWAPPALAGCLAGGLALLAVTEWTGSPGWLVPGLVLLVGFLAGVWFVASRGGLRVRPAPDPRRHLVDGLVVLAAVVVFAVLDRGAGLLLAGLGLGVTTWLQFSRLGRA